jgi:hypothetical protein
VVHPLHFSPFYLSPLLMEISTGLNILYSFLYRKCINYIHFLNFLLPSSSLVCDLPLVRPVFHDIAIFVLGYNRVSGENLLLIPDFESYNDAMLC